MITVNVLRNQLELLNKQNGLRYELTAWSPGDGWTRYQLVTAEPGGAEHPHSPIYNAAEMSAYLRGMRDALELPNIGCMWEQ